MMETAQPVVEVFDCDSPLYKVALDLRYRVLRKPLGLDFTPKELGNDRADVHFALKLDERIIACLILTRVDAQRIKMRQVAVETDLQGKGFGSVLAKAAEEYAHQNNFAVIFCHARSTAVPFYLALGYHTVGEEFEQVGIPHFQMEKVLKS